MQIRNALIILMRILPHFPMLVKLAQIIERKVEKVNSVLTYCSKSICEIFLCFVQVREEERNQRQDLFVLASSYIGQLKSKSNDMIREVDFHQVADKPNKEPAAVETKTNGIVPAGMLISKSLSNNTFYLFMFYPILSMLSIYVRFFKIHFDDFIFKTFF